MTDNAPGSLGQTLRNRRLQKELSLEEITQAIRIQPRFIKALETEQWDVFPGRIFLDGFLRRYADFLGLDGADLVSVLKERLGSVTKPAFTHPTPVLEAVDNLATTPLRLGLLFTALLLTAAGGFYFWRQSAVPARSPSLPLNQVTEPAWTPEIPAAGGEQTAAPATGETTPLQGHTLSVLAKESVWLRVRLDGAVRFEGTLAKGTIRTWPFETSAALRAGNMSSVDPSVDGGGLPGSDNKSAGDWFWPPPKAGVRPPGRRAGSWE